MLFSPRDKSENIHSQQKLKVDIELIVESLQKTRIVMQANGSKRELENKKSPVRIILLVW